MRTCELIYYPKGETFGTEKLAFNPGWGFAVSRQDEFVETEGHFRNVPLKQTREFMNWWAAHGFEVNEEAETSVFQISDDLAIELLNRWA